MKLEDFPGLTSPDAVAAERTIPPGKRNLLALINVLHSDWLVLRAGELEDFRAQYPQTFARYRVAAHFSVPLEKTSLQHGDIHWLNIDRDFYVLRRKGPF